MNDKPINCECQYPTVVYKTASKHSSRCPVHRNRPGITGKVANLTGAAIKHMATGRRKATDEQVAERFAICQGCELFLSKGEGVGECLHPDCGCALKKVGISGLNKLRLADQSCPIGKWKEV